jgi:hypothetical protein
MRYLIVLLIALSACTTPEQLAREQEAYASALRSRCAAYGFQYNTPQMAQCVMQLDATNRQAQNANSAAAIQQGAALMQSSQPRPASAPPIDCVPNGFGGYRCR